MGGRLEEGRPMERSGDLLRGPDRLMEWMRLARSHPFHQAIELHPDIIDCRLPEIARGRPVHDRTRCARLYIVVDRGAPDCHRRTDHKSDDKSHCPYSY